MSTKLLASYIRLAVQEAHLARVPNQLVSDDTEDGPEDKDESGGDVNELCGAGAAGGNALGSGNVMGYSGPWGVGYGSSFPKKKRKKRAKK